ncbi:hypothetical protein FJZ53_02965 [Candidatus Woesearchaeota archaeon]|nr:hypothetical protein [Candidatus Woesearchaeota archaeon]
MLPFTEKEKEVLSSVKDMKISYRFPRPDDKRKHPDSGHLFTFEIKKEGELYGVRINVDDGFLEGLDWESIWPAKNMLKYIRKERNPVLNNETWYKRQLSSNGWHCRIPV